jgi:hypothetical protein
MTVVHLVMKKTVIFISEGFTYWEFFQFLSLMIANLLMVVTGHRPDGRRNPGEAFHN